MSSANLIRSVVFSSRGFPLKLSSHNSRYSLSIDNDPIFIYNKDYFPYNKENKKNKKLNPKL
jgi:hypothetical protein